MDGLNYMPADGTRAAIKNRGLRHHPDGSSSKNYSVSEGRTGDLFEFKKYFYGAPRRHCPRAKALRFSQFLCSAAHAPSAAKRLPLQELG
jgi:hypothetical protein